MSIWFPFLLLISLMGFVNAFYPVYKLEQTMDGEEEEKRSAPMEMDTIRRPSKLTRGAFISPLFGYRFINNLGQKAENDDEDPLIFAEPEKRNFYTHIWRDIVQRMPAYRSANGHRLFQSNENDLDKRSPIDRMHAIRTG